MTRGIRIEEIFEIPNAFINLSDCESIDEMIEKVKAVDLDNENIYPC